MQFLVDATVEECMTKARELFSKDWPYGGTWYQQPNRVYLVGQDPDPDTWGRNIMQFALILVTFGIYFIYLVLKPVRIAGTAEIIAAREGPRTRLGTGATENKFQRVLEKWVNEEFPNAEAVAPQDEKPIVSEQQPVPVQPAPESDDIPEQIKKLAELRDSGAITAEEYEAKKSDLLGRM